MRTSSLPEGMTYRHPFWVTWRHMRDRCTRPHVEQYKDYGGRGIKVCERWLDFQNFYDDMFPSYTYGLTIERVDNEKGYEPSNCTWIPRSEQPKNRRGVKRYYGKTFADWSKVIGIKQSTLEQRYYCYKWDIDKCLNTPLRKRG